MTKIKPLGKRVLIQRSKSETSKGGILLPDSAQEKPKQGIVIAVGTGAMDDHGNFEKPSVQEGDKVLFNSYAGTTVNNQETGEEEYLIMSENDILGVLTQ
ncbi:MAG: co-chaperone GroES [Waddliaceae bacterium]|nr:co-chaperone GroES [Waddliaceae bacterium]